MFYVYILQNSKSGKHYIGSTEDLEKRIISHNSGSTKSTKSGAGNWKIIYTEKMSTVSEARKREKVIKSYKSGEAFKKLMRM